MTEQAREIACEGLLSEHEGDRWHLVWIAAEIPIPEVEEVEALAVEVEGAESES